MKTKLNGIFTLLLAFVVHLTFAQEKTISGTVTDQDGLPLPGVNIVVVGSSTGTQTDFDGNYAIQSKPGDVLLFSYVGQKDTKKTVGTSLSLNVAMTEDAQALDEVVVTAQGIRREKKALGYSVSSVGADQLENKPSQDIAQALSGQVAGVEILSGGSMDGAGANINIRGYSSITGSNQPLIVVDGTPISSSSNGQSSFNQYSGASSGSRLSDIDLNNVEKLEVLKGLSATVLYGEDGRNGVILITTKTGEGANKKSSVTVSSSIFFNQLTGLPEFQDSFGVGFQGSASKAFSNWGANFNDVTTVAHPYDGNSYTSAQGGGVFNDFFPEFVGADYDYKPYDNVGGFFKTGTSLINSVTFQGSSEKSSISATYTNTDTKGVTPGNSTLKNQIGINAKTTLANKLRIDASMNFTTNSFKAPPSAASFGSNTSTGASSVFANVLYTPRSIDLNGLPWEDSLHRSVYYRSGNDVQNPIWTVNNEKYKELTDRVFGKVSLTYPLSENINVTWRSGFDSYTTDETFSVNKGGINYSGLGLYVKNQYTERTQNHDLIFTFQKDFSEDFNMDILLGANGKKTTFNQFSAIYTDQLVYGSFFSNNFVNKNAGSFYSQQENKLGVYANATLGYKSYMYLNLSARNDWSSTHESNNNSLLYPGASVSFLPMDAFNLNKSGMVNYIKLRAGYGTSARFADPYNTRDVLGLSTNSWLSNGNVINTNTISNVIGNPDLKPELQTEIEVGLEGKFFKNRLNVDLSLYKRNAEDQIISRDLDPSSGATSTLQNLGELETKGIELLLSGTLLKTDNFSWDASINFTKYESIVVDLPDDIDQLSLSGFTNLGNFAKEGEAFNVIMGTYAERDESGNPIILDSGYYNVSSDIGVIGDPNPDYFVTIRNGFSYKNLDFGFSFEYTQGGDILSYTAATLLARGLTEDTNVDRGQTVVLPGVTQTGDPNTTQISLTDYYFDNYLYGADEALIYDGTLLRLREVTLGYSIPKKMLEKTPFGSINFSITANNLWRKAFNFPDAHQSFDPSVSTLGVSNSKGLDFMSGFATKRIGFTLKATF
ncbi:SusC/RagA family TonB-linked outer membrane protein [Cellulophaga baltica]|uniref:SusC/RagA family TonB-linked outer membrane protein n=1 Tax=Cellulophaga baltica TaxID=76594 RepID=UPI002148C23E|nr:SusC/RagA family TonB-linked outer membrane protein [Cellulophaga baltica]MCR1024415.1 SusC/RagA family TonB-linked outer membrane protein [Cellulophaga baltica]